MEELNNENVPYKYDETDRVFKFGKGPYGWGKPYSYGFGPKFPHGYGSYFPGGYYGGGLGWPWFLLALKSMSTRDLMRYMEELEAVESMNYRF